MPDTLKLTGQNALDLSGFDNGDTVVLKIQGKIKVWSEDEGEDGTNHSVTISIKSVEPQEAGSFKEAVRRSVIEVVPRIEPQAG